MNLGNFFNFRLTSHELINQETKKNTAPFVKILLFLAS